MDYATHYSNSPIENHCEVSINNLMRKKHAKRRRTVRKKLASVRTNRRAETNRAVADIVESITHRDFGDSLRNKHKK
jgi:hypothetical protein